MQEMQYLMIVNCYTLSIKISSHHLIIISEGSTQLSRTTGNKLWVHEIMSKEQNARDAISHDCKLLYIKY